MDKKTKPSEPYFNAEYVDLLKNEGDKIWDICQELNLNKDFKDSANSNGSGNLPSIEIKAENLLMRDISKIYVDCTSLIKDQTKIPVKARFILIYFYEKLQGRDLLKQYSLSQINALPTSNLFDENVKTILKTFHYNPEDKSQLEFLLSSILFKIRSEQLQGVASFIGRIATLILKADNRISAKEKEVLQQINQKAIHPKIVVDKASYNEIPENDTLEIVLAELHELIGMENIKQSIQDLVNFLKVQKLREEKGLKTANNSLHAVFMGPPGTGKTTVARMLGRIYKHMGFIDRGHLVETDRAGMVAGYVGQTAIKADEIIKTAIGGVLFIDEAYALAPASLNDFGNEAIEIILKRMEDHRENLVIVVAGYPDEMEIFIQSNPGLQSRFNRYFKFDHFTPEELLKIFNHICKKADFILTEDASDKLLEILERVYEKRLKSFGNARTVRNLFEKIIEKQANRIVEISPVTEELLKTLTEDDIPEILQAVKELTVFEEEGE